MSEGPASGKDPGLPPGWGSAAGGGVENLRGGLLESITVKGGNLNHNNFPAGGEGGGGGGEPRTEVGDPAQRAVRREHHVEATREIRRQLLRIGDDECRVEAGLFREALRPLDGDRREVEPGHPRAAPGPRQRVQTEVALDVQQVEPLYVADGSGHLAELPLVQRRCPGEESFDVVDAVLAVDAGEVVPMRAVELHRIGHTTTLSADGGSTASRGDRCAKTHRGMSR